MSLLELGVGLAAHRRIGDLKSEMRGAKQTTDEIQIDSRTLRQSIDRLYMIVEALWIVVKSKTDMTDDDLSRLVDEIDLRDGKLDGRNSDNTAIAHCRDCGKTIFRGQTKCSYCGGAPENDSIFRHG